MDFRAYLVYVAEWMGVISVILLLSLSLRFRIPPIGFKYPRREGTVALGLAALLLVVAIALYQFKVIPAMSGLSDAVAPFWLRLVAAGSAGAICMAALFVRGQPIRSMGWGRNTLGAGVRLGLALALLTIFLRGKIYALMNGVNPAEGAPLLVFLLISLAEETAFRGYIQMRLDAWLGPRWGWLLTALLYTIFNLPRLLLNPVTFWFLLFVTVGQALVLGFLAQRSQGVLAPFLYRAISEWLVFVV